MTILGHRHATDHSTPGRWSCNDPPEYKHAPPHGDGDPVGNIYNRIKQCDEVMCNAWQDEIEKCLIFAGLFSAAVTGFVITSFKYLQEDPTQTSATLLAHLSLQLAALSNNATAAPVPAFIPTPFVPSSRSIRITVFFTISLVLNLVTAVLSMLLLYWLREYLRGISKSPEEAIRIRQIRYEGLVGWKIPELISLLPIILLASVLLFSAACLDLLWSLNVIVAGTVTGAVIVIYGVFSYTAIAPVIHMSRYFSVPPNIRLTQCPYKSPLSWVILRFGVFLNRLFKPSFPLSPSDLTSWEVVDTFWHRDSCESVEGKSYGFTELAQALEWTMTKFAPELTQDIARDIFHLLHSALPRQGFHRMMQEWAGPFAGGDGMVKVALELAPDKDATKQQAQYDLFMEWLLRRFPLHSTCQELLLELRLRCLNTRNDDTEMQGTFDDALRDYTLITKGAKHPKNDEWHFQSLTTFLEYHKRDPRANFVNNYRLGKALADYIKQTPVTDGNVFMCSAILNQLTSLLEEIYATAGRWNGSTVPDDDRRSPGFTAEFLRLLDLAAVEKWEADMQCIIGNSAAVVTERLVLFMVNVLLPALDNRNHDHARDIRFQVDKFNKAKPRN